MKKVKIGIALGGGGMCGIAHIGFLKALEENNIKVDMIAGISMGAIVGGLYASGTSLKEMDELVRKISKNNIFELNAFRILKQGLFSGKKIEKILIKNLKTENIEDGSITFYAGAVDLKSGKLHTFKDGKFVDAMRASSAIPGVFAPVCLNDTMYVDGGLVENVPFNILKENGADIIIAVNCLNEYSMDTLPKNTLEILTRSFGANECTMWKYSKLLNKKNYDIYCFDSTKGVTPFSTNMKKIPEILQSGYIQGLKYIKQIKKIIEKKENL